MNPTKSLRDLARACLGLASIVLFATDRGRSGVVSATPPSEPYWRISRIRLSSQWFLSETNRKRRSRVPD